MSRVWVSDRWVKDAIVDGYRVPAPSSQRSNLADLEDRFKTSVFGVGSRWRVEWYEEDGGATRKLRTKSFKKRSDADRFRNETEKSLRGGTYINPKLGETTFQAVAEDWLKSKVKPRSSSIRIYETDLRLHIFPKWGSRRINSITSQQIQDWVAELMAGNAPTQSSRPGPMSPASIERLVSLRVGAVLRYAVRRRLIAIDPSEGIELPRVAEPSPTFLSASEVELLANHAGLVGGPQDEALVRTLAYCGLRIGEAIALRVSDLQAERRRLSVQRTITTGQNGVFTEGPTKNWQKREVPVPASLFTDLNLLSRDRSDSDYLFTSKQGHRINQHNWRKRVWDQAVEGSGLGEVEGLTPHSLRHTCASLAIKSGIDVRTLSSMLGHKKPSITLDTYSHLWPDRLDEVAEIMESIRSAAAGDQD